MADITIHDLLAWEPRLQLMRRPLPGAASDDTAERDVSWAVTIRAAAPMLSPLRGGELVLLPDRVLAEAGLALPVLLRELATHAVGAAVVETAPAVASPLPILLAPELSPDFEASLNRLLTERRGELYRSGTELGRLLAGAGPSTELEGLLGTAGSFLGCGLAVMDARGTVLARTSADAVPSGASRTILTMTSPREWRDARLLVKLAGGEVVWLGPVKREERALVRVASERIALAVEAARQRTIAERPRGAARAIALNALLLGSEEAATRTAALLGLVQDARYRVAMVSPSVDLAVLHRAVNPAAALHEAGNADGAQLVVFEAGRDSAEGRRTLTRGERTIWPGKRLNSGEWVATSAEVTEADQLPAAFRQARFVALLLAGDVVMRPIAQFDRLPDIGAFRLLYELWGTPALISFVDDALGELRRDKRGPLRATLLAYLNAGGSHVETAAALGIHRNTLAYRLRQIEALTGRDPADPELRLVMHLALVAATLPPGRGTWDVGRE